MSIEPRAQANPLSLAALGVLAYVAETLVHEAVGHGGVCMASGGSLTFLAPLYMRCSVVTAAMIAAGPAANVVTGLLCLIALQAPSSRTGAFRYFLWLSFVFNWLVAAGYLLVGAATGFGDWGALFASVTPNWHWRVPAGALALASYLGTLRLAEREFHRETGIGSPTKRLLARMVLIPAAAAAVVAAGAEIYGQGAQPLGLGLALGCTLFVGVTLMGIGGQQGARTLDDSRLAIGFDLPLAVLALFVGAAFIAFIGPGLVISSP